MLGEKRLLLALSLGTALISNLTLFLKNSFLFLLPSSYLPGVFIGIMRTCVIAVSSLKGKCYINTGYFMCAYKIYLRRLSFLLMELNKTGLFGIAAILRDLHSAKSLCFGDISVNTRIVSSSSFFSPSVESLFPPIFSVLPNEAARARSPMGCTGSVCW